MRLAAGDAEVRRLGKRLALAGRSAGRGICSYVHGRSILGVINGIRFLDCARSISHLKWTLGLQPRAQQTD